MQLRRGFKKRVIKTTDGKKSTFSYDSKGQVYDHINGGEVKVGQLLKDGKLLASGKYLEKHAHRLEQIGVKGAQGE